MRALAIAVGLPQSAAVPDADLICQQDLKRTLGAQRRQAPGQRVGIASSTAVVTPQISMAEVESAAG